MKGIELSRRFYEDFGHEILKDDALLYASAGLVGNGSECFGFDDAISQDHDFQPGFCVWVDDDTPSDLCENLIDAYNNLPFRYLGYQRTMMTVSGERRRGIFRTSDFYLNLIGLPYAPQTVSEWLNVPDYALAAATNGTLFTNNATDFTYIRNTLLHGMPRDVRLKRIAKHIALMAQSGQYNVSRCLKHGESAAARLAISEFVLHTASVIYHLNEAYPPFYKWLLRGMRDLSLLSSLQDDLSNLLMTADSALCLDLIEEISSKILLALKKKELTHGHEAYLEIHALRVMDGIQSKSVRDLHIMT